MDEGSVGNVFDGAWKWAYGSVDLWELIVVYTCICGRTPLNGPPVLPLLKLKWLLPIHTSWGRGEHTPPVWQDHCLLRSMTHGFNCQSVGEAPLNLLTLPSFPFTATGHGLIECMWNAGLYNYAKLAYIMKECPPLQGDCVWQVVIWLLWGGGEVSVRTQWLLSGKGMTGERGEWSQLLHLTPYREVILIATHLVYN